MKYTHTHKQQITVLFLIVSQNKKRCNCAVTHELYNVTRHLLFPGEEHDVQEGDFFGRSPQDAGFRGGPASPHRVGEDSRQTVLHRAGKPEAHC